VTNMGYHIDPHTFCVHSPPWIGKVLNYTLMV
jgi:hypothetical protein